MRRFLRGAVSFAMAVAVGPACGNDDSKQAAMAVCRPPARVSDVTVGLEVALGGLTFESPVEMIFGPGGRAYVVEQEGVVRVVSPAGGTPSVALDIRSRLVAGGEAGLLGLAFDPRFAENGFVYLYFTAELEEKDDVDFQDVLVRMTSLDGGATFDSATEKILLSVDDPFANHNGGKIAFGPDGMLYVGLGDGGSSGDPRGNGQNTNALLGKILRLDPHSGDPYGIPRENPFVGGGGRPEIYAYGIRNPWKFSFDSVTGDLWLGDVGQRNYEEVDKVVVGGNYGWNVREGRHCYADPTCLRDGFIDPITEYSHADGVSITGGYVYRGTKVPSLVAKFIYGDFGSGNVWSVDGQGNSTLLLASNLRISSFAQDPDGEVYVLDYASGSIKRLVAVSSPPLDATSGSLLSETGCLDPASARAPLGAIAYDVNSPLWSDGADKDRWLFVPSGKKVVVRADGDLDIPPGSTAVKTFAIGGRKVETRLLARYESGEWAGWSYEWNDEQTEAVLIEGGKAADLPDGRSWYFPSRAECFACHTPSAGFSLGLEARQLDRGDVLARFAGHLDRRIGRGDYAALPATDSSEATTEQRARGYLHANCSMCHRPGVGAGAATFDLRFDRPLAEMGVCNAVPQGGDLGVPNARIVAPGDPGASTLTLRMRSLDENRMPPLASHMVDEAGVARIEAWITELAACP